MKNSLVYKLIDKRIDQYITQKQSEVHFKKGKGLLEKSRKTKIMGSEKKSENSKDSGYSKIGSERMFASRGLLQGKHQRDHKALSQAA
jgi:hypothetical protein